MPTGLGYRIEAERQAFEHAARLAKKYRKDFKTARNAAIIEGVLIVFLCAMYALRWFNG